MQKKEVKSMLRGLYAAGSGMIAQQRRQEMLTNNLSNIETPGYKSDEGSMRTFPSMLINAMGTDHQRFRGSNHVGELATGVYMQERTPNFRQGDMQETGNNTDVALMQGIVPTDEESGQDALLVYETRNDDGELRFTRNGNFTIDGEGFLTTSNGHYILGDDGEPINVQNETIRVTSDGEIFSETEELLGQISVSVIADPAQLVKEGGGFLRYDGENDVITALNNGDVTYQLQQGFIERSNVDGAQTVTEMMTALRSFEANQKMLQAYDQSMERAVNDIGRIG
jgi:flagellar basal-body rod protein FlgF